MQKGGFSLISKIFAGVLKVAPFLSSMVEIFADFSERECDNFFIKKKYEFILLYGLKSKVLKKIKNLRLPPTFAIYHIVSCSESPSCSNSRILMLGSEK